MFDKLIETVKENPVVVMLGSSGSIIAIVGALFTVDDRYAHAADVEKTNTEIRKSMQESTNTLRRRMLEDKVFELDIRGTQNKDGKLSPVEKALRERYQSEINDLRKQQP
jgi:hypothetical protein